MEEKFAHCVYNLAKRCPSMKIAPPSRCRSVPSAKRLVPTSSCWDMAYKTYLWDFPVLNAMVSAGSCFPQTPCQAATLSAPIPATVVGSCVSGTPLPFLHLGWRARLCFAAACSGCFAFCFCFFVTSRCQQALLLPMAALLFLFCPYQLTVQPDAWREGSFSPS